MKHLLSLLALLAPALGAQPALEFNEQLEAAALHYTQQIEVATDELVAARTQIATTKVPLINALRAAEDRLLQLRARQADAGFIAGNLDAELAQREAEAKAQRLNINFFAQAATESLSIWSTTTEMLDMHEDALLIRSLRDRLNPNHGEPQVAATTETVEQVFARVQAALGGQQHPGQALIHETRTLATGQYVRLGPSVLFVSDDGETYGTVRSRNHGETPLVHVIPGWKAASAQALVAGQVASVPSDVTGGKALQLSESQGNWFTHVRKGGLVGYVILGIGAFALLVVGIKLVDLRKLDVDSPARTQPLLDQITAQGSADTAALLEPLRRTSRALFAHGLKHLAKPREVIEEHLHAFILRERLLHERWLPMLAVIAAASPLLGLLGTVVGMVKTFTLITVFGTGNAAKLSSGISEALVTTELGLMVAIPALVLHGFLAYRTHKNLSLLERYSAEFIAAAEDYKSSIQP